MDACRNDREGRSRRTHPGGLGDGNKLASGAHRWWPVFRSFVSSTRSQGEKSPGYGYACYVQKRRLTSLISDENENEFDPFFSLSPSLRRLLFVSATVSFSLSLSLLPSLTSVLSMRPCPQVIFFLRLQSIRIASFLNILNFKEIFEFENLMKKLINFEESTDDLGFLTTE